MTPAHDFVDFEIARRHELPLDVTCIDEAGVVTDAIPSEFAGMDRFKAREMVRLRVVSTLRSHFLACNSMRIWYYCYYRLSSGWWWWESTVDELSIAEERCPSAAERAISSSRCSRNNGSYFSLVDPSKLTKMARNICSLICDGFHTEIVVKVLASFDIWKNIR